MSSLQIHATAVALEGAGVLILGPSGSGKSDLAYRLIMEQGARLIADDQTCLSATDNALSASSRDGWEGLLELRGLGIVSVPYISDAPVGMAIELVPRSEVPRLSEPAEKQLCGVSLPLLRLHAFDVTTPLKVVLAAAHLPGRGFPGEDGRFGER